MRFLFAFHAIRRTMIGMFQERPDQLSRPALAPVFFYTLAFLAAVAGFVGGIAGESWVRLGLGLLTSGILGAIGYGFHRRRHGPYLFPPQQRYEAPATSPPSHEPLPPPD